MEMVVMVVITVMETVVLKVTMTQISTIIIDRLDCLTFYTWVGPQGPCPSVPNVCHLTNCPPVVYMGENAKKPLCEGWRHPPWCEYSTFSPRVC